MCGSTRGAATVLSVCRGRVGHAVTWPNLGKASRTVHFFGSAVASTISWLHVRVPENKRWVGACAGAPHQTSLASPHQTSLESQHAGISPGSAAGGGSMGQGAS